MTQAPVSPLVLPEGYYQSFTHTVDGKKIRVWAIKENWTYFVTDTSDAAQAIAPVTWSVGLTKVRRFPGDPEPFTRRGYTATKTLPVTRGRAIPGKPFALEDDTHFRVFSYVGSLSHLYAILSTNKKRTMVLHTPSGRSMVIEDTTP